MALPPNWAKCPFTLLIVLCREHGVTSPIGPKKRDGSWWFSSFFYHPCFGWSKKHQETLDSWRFEKKSWFGVIGPLQMEDFMVAITPWSLSIWVCFWRYSTDDGKECASNACPEGITCIWLKITQIGLMISYLISCTDLLQRFPVLPVLFPSLMCLMFGLAPQVEPSRIQESRDVLLAGTITTQWPTRPSQRLRKTALAWQPTNLPSHLQRPARWEKPEWYHSSDGAMMGLILLWI